MSAELVHVPPAPNRAPATAPQKRIYLLNHSHRCDRCGSKAYMRVILAAGELLFCGHHGNKYLPKLMEALIWLLDERDALRADVTDDKHWVEGQEAHKPGAKR